ncbi:MAG: hypothetical protein HGA66_10150 [Holophaga sp.]|nr:hypothetical protein [Holophaga sp.]
MSLARREWRDLSDTRLPPPALSYREIAEQLGSSPNTVRVQLARVYQKLDINDKATLARALGEVRGSA